MYVDADSDQVLDLRRKWAFVRGFFAYAISVKLPCACPFIKEKMVASPFERNTLFAKNTFTLISSYCADYENPPLKNVQATTQDFKHI